MSIYAAPIEVVQAALGRVGDEVITDLAEASPAALIASANYEGLVRANLCRHAWLFAKRTDNLTLEGPVTSGDYVWSWILPPDILNLRWVQSRGQRLRFRDYTLEGARVLTIDPFAGADCTPQSVSTIRAPENLWPDDFAEGMVTRLEGLFMGALADKWQDGRTKIGDAEKLMQAAIVRDKRQQPATSQEFNRLAERWRFRGARSRYLG